MEPTLTEVIDIAFDSLLKDLHTCTGGVIDRFYPGKMCADINLANKQVYKNSKGELVSETVPILANVPAGFHSGGNLTMTFPVQKGDTCMVVFSEDDLNAFRANGKKGNTPGLIQRFTFSSSFFIPMKVKNQTYSPTAYDSSSVVISGSGAPPAPVALANLVDTNLQAILANLTALNSYVNGLAPGSIVPPNVYIVTPVASSKLKA
jgi:hypothetical protein